MQSSQNFNGLTMPVFSAFGWAEEEAALNYALSQLELFIAALHARLPQTLQRVFPYFGLSRENQTVYLAADSEVESDLHVVFYARPMSLEIQMVATEQTVLTRGFRNLVKDAVANGELLRALGADWSLRMQQRQVDEETGETAHYQDLYKDSVANLDEETAVALFEKGAYLNGESNWVVPVYVSRRMDAEQVSVMGQAVVQVIADEIGSLLPIVALFKGKQATRKPRSPKAAPAKPKAAAVKPVTRKPIVPVAPGTEEFTYVAELKPLHIRRGFVNLTSQHWPFFAKNARTETRKVAVHFEGAIDKESSVWRLQPDDQARLVLGTQAHEWLEDRFDPGDHIQLTARKIESNEIQVTIETLG